MSKDNYVGLTIGDEATEIPAAATVHVTLHAATWAQFEQHVEYLKGIALPGLHEPRRLAGVGVYREAEPEGGPKVIIHVNAPHPALNANHWTRNERKIEEVLARVAA